MYIMRGVTHLMPIHNAIGHFHKDPIRVGNDLTMSNVIAQQ